MFSNVHVLTYPTNPWVDWERERLLNFHDSVLVSVFLRHSELVVVSLANEIVSQVCAVQVPSVVGMTKLALFLDQTQDFVSLSPCAVPSGTVSGSWYTLCVVAGGFRPYFRRYSYRRASHPDQCVCLHVPTRTLCILASEPISLGLPRRHHQV